jgi:hypothetical protein
LILHVTGGAVGLLSGFAALGTTKGSRSHRSSGRVFVYAMLAMALSGAGIAAVTGVETSVVMGLLTAYLVFTGVTAISPLPEGLRWTSLAGAGLASVLAVALIDIGRRALTSPEGDIEGLPAPMAFLFAAVAAAAGASDIRPATRPRHDRRRRVARHLWRMCLALFIAAASFFLGQTNVLPAPLRAPALLAVPVLAPLLVMAFWLWRSRRRPALAEAPSSHAVQVAQP